MSILSTKSDKVFFIKNSQYTISNKVDLILAPEFYWVRVFEIPVKNISQAKNVLPTLFEDLLDDITLYSYKAIKLEDGKFLCFAYNNKEILEEIKNSGVNTNFINSVYFAQTEFTEFKSFNYNNESYIYTNENLLVKLPNSCNQNFENIKEKINSLNLSTNKIDIKFYNNLISTKQLRILSVILIIFIFVNIVNIAKLNSQTNNIETQKIEFITNNSLPNSQLQLNSIVDEYKKNIDIEFKKRKIYKFLSDNRKINVENFSIKDKVVEFRFTNKTLLGSVQNFAKKFKAKITPKTQYIEVRIEL